MIVCSKVRVGDVRTVTVTEGTASGRHCVIVDDLVQSGGTLLECAKCLKDLGSCSAATHPADCCLLAGATKVSCFVTHGIVPCSQSKQLRRPCDSCLPE